MNGWNIEFSNGTAEQFHQRKMPDALHPSIWVHKILRPALVLGSSQPQDLVNKHKTLSANIELCRRRSGGGLVRIDPLNDLWIDVFLPRNSQLWSNDVAKAMVWVGEVWAEALHHVVNNISTDSIKVHTGAQIQSQAGSILCFAGLGTGEVTVDGYKTVGISQRRTRQGARFQCLVKTQWSPQLIRPYIHTGTDTAISWENLRIGLPPQLVNPKTDLSRLQDSFIQKLPRA